MQDLNLISGAIVDASLRIHKKLGPGLLESVYEVLLARDLMRLGLDFERQKVVSFEFEGVRFEDAFRVDLLVEGLVVVEIKSSPTTTYVYEKQLLTYVRLLNCKLGLLLNFGEALMKSGIRRIANGC
jgi:GxxExxY protein